METSIHECWIYIASIFGAQNFSLQLNKFISLIVKMIEKEKKLKLKFIGCTIKDLHLSEFKKISKTLGIHKFCSVEPTRISIKKIL